MHTLFKIVVVLLPLSLYGQINFYRHYSGSGADFGEGVVQLEDSSYVICGSSSSFSNNSQAFLMKVDSLGNYIWSRHYGGFEHESARRVLYKQNFGFFITGHTSSMGAGAYDYYLAKVDESGGLEWEKSFGGIGWDRVRDAVLTRDTGVVMVGERTYAEHTDWYIIRTDSNGDTLWTKTFGREGDDVANTIRSYHDSLFVVGGTVFNQDSLLTKSMLVFMHEDGTVLDSLEMGDDGAYELNDLSIWNDSIQAVGNYKPSDTSGFKITFFTAEINGQSIQLLSNFFYDQVGDNYGQLITSYNNGAGRYTGLARANQATVIGPGQDQYITIHGPTLSYLGSACWMTGAYPDVGGQFIETSDGGAAMVGWRGNIGPGEGTVFLLKIGLGEVYPTVSNTVIITDIVSVVEFEELEGVKMYPNPANDVLNLSLDQMGDYSISIRNMLGQEVMNEHVNSSTQLDVSQIESGNYIVTITSGNAQSRRKIIIN